MIIKDIIDIMENLAPPCLAMPDDKIGLQIGNANNKVSKIVVTLDITKDSVDFAVKNKADLIISHHPYIFNPITKISTPTLLEKILKHNISIYAAHTNLDSCIGGVNDVLAEIIGLSDTKIFEPTHMEKLYKLVVFVPKDHTEKVRASICNAGAGNIGNYDNCTFTTAGSGTFRALKNANPFIGKKGVIEHIDEDRIETIISEFSIKEVLSSMLTSHPYEEVAYDIYPLENPGRIFGLGRYGILNKPTSLKNLANNIKKTLNCPNIQVFGNPNKVIKTAVVWSGRGRGKINSIKNCGADVFVVGEIMYEDILLAKELGVSVIIAGHFETEDIIIKPLADYLTKKTNLLTLIK